MIIQRASRAAHIPSDRVLRQWARAVLPGDAQVTVRFVAEAEGRRLNREYRGKDYATNVLSFPYSRRPLAGDLVICAPVPLLRVAITLPLPGSERTSAPPPNAALIIA